MPWFYPTNGIKITNHWGKVEIILDPLNLYFAYIRLVWILKGPILVKCSTKNRKIQVLYLVPLLM